MGLFSSLGGLFGGGDAADDLSKELAKIAGEVSYKPRGVNTPFFGIGFKDDGTAHITNSKRGLYDTFNHYGKLINQAGNRARNFDPRSFENEFFRSIDRLESQREAEGFADFESALFNRAGVHTGTSRLTRDFQESLQQRRFDRQQRAVESAQQYKTNILNQFLSLDRGRSALNETVLSPMRLGASIGTNYLNADLARANMLAQGAGFAAGGDASMASGIGGLLDMGMSFFGGGGGSSIGNFVKGIFD